MDQQNKEDEEESIWEITEDGQLILEKSGSGEEEQEEDNSKGFKIEKFEDYLKELLAANGGSLPDFGLEKFPELFWSKKKSITDGKQDIRSTHPLFHKVPNSMKFYITLLNAKSRRLLEEDRKKKEHEHKKNIK